MSDGDIWGGARLTGKWLAVGAQRLDDMARGVGVSQEQCDHVASALADTCRRADRQPCEVVIDALIALRRADVVTWHNALERIEREVGTPDAQIACRAAISMRRELADDATDSECRLAYFESWVGQAYRHMESSLNARLGLESARSALLSEHAKKLAAQLAKGPDARVRAPKRVAPAKDTEAILEMGIT